VKKKETCKIENCKQPVKGKGYCVKHYRKWRQGEYGKARYKTCGEENCRKPCFAKGYCEEHYRTVFLGQAAGEAAPAPPAAEPKKESPGAGETT
jgi:hypothetical protein